MSQVPPQPLDNLPPPAYLTPLAYAPRDTVPAWPKVIGIISIVLAGLSLTSCLFGLALLLVGPRIGGVGRIGFVPRGLPGMPGWFGIYQVLATLIALGLGALLLGAGIQLVRLRRTGVTLHLGYALIDVFRVVVGTAFSLSVLPTMMSMGPAGSMSKNVTNLSIVATPGGALLTLIYPVFLLIWFNRGTIKAQAAQWLSP